ncbi:hypothetical protein [Fontibacillus sp. BL9]|uniref:hypothetical protein n=1 Tax=Fontibacillus sp. BL9 TaxID=3389971 RepID=UPI00397DD006
MTVQQMKEDLDYLVSTIGQVHPALIEGWNREQQDLIDEVYERAQTPMTSDQFYFIANEIITILQDAHTAMSPYSRTTKTLRLPLDWTQEGPIVLTSQHDLQRGDLLLSLGGFPFVSSAKTHSEKIEFFLRYNKL